MKYRVQLKTEVTAWVEVEVPAATIAGYEREGSDVREVAADDAVGVESAWFREFLGQAIALAPARMNATYGPIELAREELDESVRVIA